MRDQGQELPNPGIPGDTTALQEILPSAVATAERYPEATRQVREAELNEQTAGTGRLRGHAAAGSEP
ncbi:hypothetical protein [Halomonas sp. NO4]|uniref:hypothetical protein n=1 Tax=Halomonas sp. NO4 TaxID=2484813 RepID=UPI0013D5B592|nr:hypothetical protein [Halomonas sp. NO4]